MKYGLILLLLALAAVEYFHHRADGHTHGGVVTSDADDQQAKREKAREIYRQHMRSHQ